MTGTGTDGERREVYLFHVVDNDWCMSEYGSQAVVWQTAVNPVLALELIASGAWSGVGLLGPEALPPAPFLELLERERSPLGIRGAHPELSGRGPGHYIGPVVTNPVGEHRSSARCRTDRRRTWVA